MSYDVQFSGRIEIEPPIPWGKIKNSDFLPERAKTGKFVGKRYVTRDACFHVGVEERDTDEGTLHVKVADAVVYTWDSRGGEGSFMADLQEIVDLFPEHEFTGRIDCAGEEAGDIYRIKVVDRTAKIFSPKLVWPAESE